MSHLESESMTLKRLEVALKKKNWQLLEYGISKAFELINSGIHISHLQEWAYLGEKAKSINSSEPLINQLSEITDRIIQNSNPIPDSEAINTMGQGEITTINPIQSDVIRQAKKIISPGSSFAVVIDSLISKEEATAAFNLNNTLNKQPINNDSKIEIELLSNLAKLVKNSNRPYEELEGFDKFITSCNRAGTIITTGYNVEIIKILNKCKIDYALESLKKPETNDFWKLYPLAGLSSIFYCISCNTRVFIEKSGNITLAACPNCSCMCYPLLYNIDTPGYQSHPTLWYTAYNALIEANNWLLVLQSDMSNKRFALKLIMDAYNKSNNLHNIHIVSSNAKIADYWKNKLEKVSSNANIGAVYFNVDLFLKNNTKLSEVISCT